MPKKSLITVPSISRRTRRRGLWVSGAVGLLTLIVGFARTPHVKYDAVVTATQPLPAGTIVTARDVAVQKVPAPGVPGAASASTAIVGRKLTYAVVAHQPIMTADLQAAQLVQGLAPGQVGVMLPVSLASSDNVRPGDLVSVVWIGSASSASSTSAADSAIGLTPGSALASGLRVLDVLNSDGTPVSATPTSGSLTANTPASVEVAAPQALAGTLALAAQSGQFWLTLDPWSDTPPAAVAGVTFNGTAPNAPTNVTSARTGASGAVLPSTKHVTGSRSPAAGTAGTPTTASAKP